MRHREPEPERKEYPANPEGIKQRFQDAMPGMTDAYYTKQVEGIVTAALINGFNVGSVCDAFIQKAIQQGDNRNAEYRNDIANSPS